MQLSPVRIRLRRLAASSAAPRCPSARDRHGRGAGSASSGRMPEAEHREVSGLLDQVEAAALLPDGPDTVIARQRLAVGLATHGSHLLGHLVREEEALAPVLLTWEHWSSE